MLFFPSKFDLVHHISLGPDETPGSYFWRKCSDLWGVREPSNEGLVLGQGQDYFPSFVPSTIFYN